MALPLPRTRWYEEIRGLLRDTTEASLLEIVLHFWPGFISWPSERRALLWFWLKSEMRSLAAEGELRETVGAEGVTMWSLPRRLS